jgi:hypothetical protein
MRRHRRPVVLEFQVPRTQRLGELAVLVDQRSQRTGSVSVIASGRSALARSSQWFYSL